MKELAMQPNSATNLPGGFILALLVLTLLAGLPTAVWLDLTNLSDAALHRQAADLNSVITSMRGYYASNVVGRRMRDEPA
jgi:adenylate cyclase